jgi:mannose-6-phosphate isomerase
MERGTERLDELLAGGPLRLLPNRVRRFYRGGALLDRFRGVAAAGTGAEGRDGDEPEDWVGSATSAWRPTGAASTVEGLSTLPDLDGRLLREVVDAVPDSLAGPGLADAAGGPTTGLLVKLLDSAIRLPVHAHPSRPFARRVLGSFFGKTEAWLVLATRQVPGEDVPHLRLGFRHDVDAAELRGWIEAERTEPLLDALHRREVHAGDAWLVPGGMPHAIGAGVFLVELQEPVDFSIVTETRGFPIRAGDAHLGLGWDLMIDSIDRTGRSADELDGLRGVRVRGEPAPGVEEETLLPGAADPYFRATRLTAHGGSPWPYDGSMTIGIVTAGEATIAGLGRSLELRRGTTFLVPAIAASRCHLIVTSASVEIVCSRPPHPDLLRAS